MIKIKKKYQALIPESKVLNMRAHSPIHTYSCDMINDITRDTVPINTLFEYEGDTVPEGYELVEEIENVGSNNKLRFLSVTASQTRALTKQTPVIVPYDTITTDRSDGKLILENNGITIGKGVKCVRITAQVGVQNSATGYDMKTLGLYKNDEEICISSVVCYNVLYAVATPNMVKLLEVQEGDVLTLKTWFETVNTVTLINAWNTWTVEIVDCSEGNEIVNTIPSEYVELQYLQSTDATNHGVNYIDTDYVPNTDTQIEMKFYIPEGAHNYDKIYGSSRAYMLEIDHSKNHLYTYLGDNSPFQYAPNYRTDYILKLGNGELYLNNNKVHTFENTSLTETNKLRLFSSPVAQHDSIVRIYYFTVKENNQIIHDFIPVFRKSDKTVGMFDLVNQKFYAAVGSDKFEYAL